MISNLQPYARPRNWINQYNYLLEIPFVNYSSSWARKEGWNFPDCKLAGKTQLYWRAGIRNGLGHRVLKGYRNQAILYPGPTAGAQQSKINCSTKSNTVSIFTGSSPNTNEKHPIEIDTKSSIENKQTHISGYHNHQFIQTQCYGCEMVPTGWCTGTLGAWLAVLFPALDPSEAGLAGGSLSLTKSLGLHTATLHSHLVQSDFWRLTQRTKMVICFTAVPTPPQ